MNEYNIYHSIEISRDKFYIPGTFIIHYNEPMEDDSRKGIKEKYLFDGFSINFLIFEAAFGVKVYQSTI